jgi:hypothetical protein
MRVVAFVFLRIVSGMQGWCDWNWLSKQTRQEVVIDLRSGCVAYLQVQQRGLDIW